MINGVIGYTYHCHILLYDDLNSVRAGISVNASYKAIPAVYIHEYIYFLCTKFDIFNLKVSLF